MILGAAIVSTKGDVFCSNLLPFDLRAEISKHANNFTYTIGITDDDIEIPYVETTFLRYIYKQTDDLYWVLVTETDSKLHSDVRLMGKLVCTIMEYGSSETNSSTLTDEQRDLFYRHIWRPWDNEQCTLCGYHCSCNRAELWEREFDTRVNFFISIRDGHVEENDVAYFNGLLSEAWDISAKVFPRSKSERELNLNYLDSNSEKDSVCSRESESISEETLIDGCRLKCRLEDIRITLQRIQDPYLRLFARRDLLGTCFNQPIQSSTAPSFEEIDSQSQE